MPAKQGDNRDKVKALCVLSLLAAVCMIVGYLESLIDLSFIVPGIKIGLANSVACLLIFSSDIKGAYAVNITRILLTALLFGSAVSLAFSLAGGIISLTVMVLLKRCKWFSVIGVSAAGGAVHNAAQCAVGVILTGRGVIYYLPLLIAVGVVCGALIGFLSMLLLKRTRRVRFNV